MTEGPRMPGPRPKRGVPEGLWLKCNGCRSTIYRKEAEQMLNVCPQCGFHWYVSAKQRIEQLFDPGTFEEWDGGLLPTDPLTFSDKKPYAKRIVSEQKRTGLSDAALTGTGMIRARRVACGVTDSSFIMGSMGSVVGERLARLVERATTESLPLIIISASGGGARMHEGILSLMQMAKVSAALARYSESGGLFISVLTNPTMGGVAASFASLGDLVFAEPRALIGFAGPRTIKRLYELNFQQVFKLVNSCWSMASLIESLVARISKVKLHEPLTTVAVESTHSFGAEASIFAARIKSFSDNPSTARV